MKARISAITLASHIPSSPNISGMIMTKILWNKSVLKNDIKADITPLFSAVNIEEAKILKPQKRNE